MKVKELIVALKKQDPEKEVWITGHRRGFSPREIREGRHERTKDKVVLT